MQECGLLAVSSPKEKSPKQGETEKDLLPIKSSKNNHF